MQKKIVSNGMSGEENQRIDNRSAEQWAHDIFSGCDLEDQRRTQRLETIAASTVQASNKSFAASANGDQAQVEATYRWLENDAIDPMKVLKGGCESTNKWLDMTEGDVVAACDTSTLSFKHEIRHELGDLGGPKDAICRGFFVHSIALISAFTGEYLGLGDQYYWMRLEEQRGTKDKRKERGYDDKESFKWELTIEQAYERFISHINRIIFTSDRESDIYELMLYLHGHDLRHVIRASYNRNLSSSERKLFDEVSAAPKLGEIMVRIPQRGGRPARLARVRLRACTVELAPPDRDKYLPILSINVVQAEELCSKEPMRWVLLTTEPIETFDNVVYVIHCYGLRWKIEDFHKIWKKGGTHVEELRLETPENMLRGSIVLAFAAVRLLQLRDGLDPEIEHGIPQIHTVSDFTKNNIASLEDENEEIPQASVKEIPHRPCTDVLTTLEWQILWLTVEKNSPVPSSVPDRRWAYRAIGKLGGWTDSKRTGRVGVKTLWQGYFRLQDKVTAVLAAQHAGITIENEM